MDKNFVLKELKYANEFLTNAIQEIEGDDDDGMGQFIALLPLVYRHLNRAWNGRMITDQEIRDYLSGKDHPEEWFDFPRDLEALLR